MPAAEIRGFAELNAGAGTSITVWSVGVTQHAHGEQNVLAIVNLALAMGRLGRPHCGLNPSRGHSGVQAPGHRVGEAGPEWQIPLMVAERVSPERGHRVRFDSTAQIREEIARVVRAYDGIQHLKRTGESVQWGGPVLCAGAGSTLRTAALVSMCRAGRGRIYSRAGST